MNAITGERTGTGFAAAKATRDAIAIKPINAPLTVGKFTIRKAERSNSKLRIALAGPAGSGKTYSALLMAHGITGSWENIYIIDTENGSADLYSHIGPYKVLTLEKPFSPDRYIEAMHACESAGAQVIIIDSITHEWSGDGGALAIQEQLGGTFAAWAKVTPIHNRFIQAILMSSAHIITTVRSKMDHQVSNEGGKIKVQKVGLKSETRDGFEYEVTVSFDLNINNIAESTKDRTGLFKGGSPEIITEETGQKLIAWASSGQDIIGEIRKQLERTGKDETPILNTYRVGGLEELTTAQMKGILQRIEQLPDAPAKPKATVKKTEGEES